MPPLAASLEVESEAAACLHELVSKVIDDNTRATRPISSTWLRVGGLSDLPPGEVESEGTGEGAT